MLVSHRKKFIYTKTTKTAGTSIESYFEKYCLPENEWIESHDREFYIGETGIIGCRGNKCKEDDIFISHDPAIKIKN